jgi:hypothetical protein
MTIRIGFKYDKPVVNHPGSNKHLLADCPALYIID